MTKLAIGDIVRICTPNDWNKTGMIISFTGVQDADGWVKVKQGKGAKPKVHVLYFDGEKRSFPLDGTYAIRVEHSVESFLERELKRYGNDA